MSDDAFTVEPFALETLADTLFRLSASLDEARAMTLEMSVSGFGQPKLSDSAHQFVDHWNWQAQRLGSTLEDTAGRLNQAAAQYRQVEESQLKAEGGSTF
jgi:hypothetical protein